MSDPMTEWRRQLEAMGRQFWGGMGAAPAAPASAPVDPFTAWMRMAQPPTPDAAAMVERFSRQAQDYLGMMQGAMAGLQQDAGAPDLARAWRDTLAAASGGNPFLAALGSLNGGGARTLEQLTAGVDAWLAPLQQQMAAALSLPSFGPAREQQQRMQALARDQLALHQAMNRYSALLAEAGEQAFAGFEKKLAERSEPGRQLESARAVYDLWIDAAEEAYAEMATSGRFRDVYGALADAQMRVRKGVQEQVERACNELGMPTRSELDSAHRRIHALTRELRELRSMLDAGGTAAAAPAAKRPASSRGAPRKPAAAKKPPAPKPAASKRAVAKRARTRK